MNFYSFRPDFGYPGIGVRSHVPNDFPWEDPRAEANLQKNTFPDFEPLFSDVILTDESELTDFIFDGAIGGWGEIISEKVRRILEKFKLTQHRYYPLSVYHRGRLVDSKYYWWQILESQEYHWIDFKNSSFFIDPHDFISKPYNIEVKNAEHLYYIKRELPLFQKIYFQYLKLNDDYYSNPVDLFFFSNISDFPIVTERLKIELDYGKIVALREWNQLDIR